VGNRPIKLKKADNSIRPVEIGHKKAKQLERDLKKNRGKPYWTTPPTAWYLDGVELRTWGDVRERTSFVGQAYSVVLSCSASSFTWLLSHTFQCFG